MKTKGDSLWTNLTNTNAASAITFTTPNTGIRMPAKTPRRGLRSMNYPITGYALTAVPKKKISRILDEQAMKFFLIYFPLSQ